MDLTQPPIDVTLAGEQLKLSELSDADHVAMDSYVQGRCVAAARASLGDDATQEEWDRVVGAAARAAAGLTWVMRPGRDALFTPQGYARLMWLGLRKEHPKLTEQRARELLKKASQNERRALSDAYVKVNGLEDSRPTRPGEGPG